MLNNNQQTDSLKKRHLVTSSHPDSIISDQFRMIRTNIRFLNEEKQNRTILVTSPGKGEGKSTMVANLAVSMAQQNEKVLLIDANLRNPILHSIFRTTNNIGLTDVLTSKENIEDAVYLTGVANLEVLTSGSTSVNPAELLGSKLMSEFLKDIVEIYDLVLIDSPPLLKSTETSLLANQCDGVVMVLKRGKTQWEKAAKARRVLELAHANLVGAIVNSK